MTSTQRQAVEVLRETARIGNLLGLVALVTLAMLAPAQASQARCEALAGQKLARSVSKLPTAGGSVTSATFLPAAGETPAFCKILGRLDPVDRLGWPILFEVNLPESWNGKAAQFGGGGTNGVLVQATGPFHGEPPGIPSPLAQGFATFGTDAGHPILRPDSQIFAFNSEAVINQAYAAYKKTHDVALFLVKGYYGREPRHVYFLGSSEGGREAMLAVQRYPDDYDGAIAIVPAMNWVGQHLAHYREWLLEQDGGWISPAKIATVQKAVTAACDGLDGLADGVVSQYEGCEAVFKPASLRCPNGDDAGDACLSDRQLAFLDGVWSRAPFAFPIANGLTSYPPSPYGGEAHAGSMIGSIILAQPPKPGDTGRPLYGPGSVRYFFARDPEFTGPFDQSKYEDRLKYLSRLFDATDPDLSRFAARGGKYIVEEHGSDYLVSPFGAYEYYKAVVAKMGRPKVDSFLRFYVAPGLNHGGKGSELDGSEVPNATDLLGALDSWVEKGQAPGQLTVASYAKEGGAPLASRPLCFYGFYPHYVGGDAKQASSFVCRKLPTEP